jgi:hypothetical protein
MVGHVDRYANDNAGAPCFRGRIMVNHESALAFKETGEPR